MDFLNTFATPSTLILQETSIYGENHLDLRNGSMWSLHLRCTNKITQSIPFSQLPNGLISTNVDTGIDWFFAWNLPSTPLTLQIDTPDGSTITTVYHPQEGDILSALYYALPTEE